MDGGAFSNFSLVFLKNNDKELQIFDLEPKIIFYALNGNPFVTSEFFPTSEFFLTSKFFPTL